MAMEEENGDVVLKAISKDPLGVDLTVSIFFAAATNYRHDTVLRPFPSQFIGENRHEKQYDKLVEILKRIPQLRELHSKKKDEEVVDILHWCIKQGKFSINSCSLEKFSVIAALTGHSGTVPTPTHIFEVKYCNSSEERFQERRGDRDLLYAYHGSRLENFHCILHQGLQGHMNKNALFGEGTYLSSELTVSLPYAPAGSGWKESIIGQNMSCIAVCEIIDDPKSVKCQEKSANSGEDRSSNTSIRNRSRIANSIGGDIPEKYYVVRNNDSLRVKFLLVYADHKKKKDIRRSWLFQHKFLVMIFIYGAILVIIGVCNSKLGQKIRKYLEN